MAIKVKQSTIDEIKKMGMTKALASAKTRRSPEYQEALRRMYGERRLTAAMKGAQGGSQPKATYMYKGTSSGAATAKRKAMTGRSTPGAPAGTGARQQSSRSKGKMGTGAKVGAGAAGTVAAGAAGVYAKGKSVAKKRANMTPAQLRAEMKRVTDRAQKIAGSKTGKAIGKVSRAVTGAAARRTALGTAAIYGGGKALSMLKESAAKTKARRKAGKKDTSVGGSRATAIKKARGK
jgi:hypothetical protein